ncbi:hypothetical protein [Salinispora oceanensis]|uniref:hypothetical protein n=1 Tax=Salinispora oceanensis TaxID=1050199 RepID=UPI00036737AD|nr:hypothetical protein [Salinispora oceanensis]
MEVRRIGPELVEAAAGVLAEAFDGYSWTAWTVGADRHRERLAHLFAMTLTTVGLPYGDVWAALDTHGHPQAVAVWLRSDRPVPDEVWVEVAAGNAEYAGDRHAAMLAAEAACAPLRAAEPAFLLATVETSASANLRFYRRCGFEVTGEVTVPGGGPRVWAMRRPPARV